jgi:lipopolysaccharide heptosyltransferase II
MQSVLEKPGKAGPAGSETVNLPVDTAWQKVERILCVRLDSLGDVLMTTPAIRALKESHPGRTITLLTSPVGARIAALIPEIDEVMVYDAPWMKAAKPHADSRSDYVMAATLRQSGFEAAVIFTVYSQSPLPAAFLTYLAGIPLCLAHCRENPYQLLSHWVPENEPEAAIRHETRRQLDLVASVGCRTEDERLSLRVSPKTERAVARLLGQLGFKPDRPWVVVHPGASARSRRYQPEGFAEVARRLYLDYGIPAIFTGAQGEIQLVESIQAEAGIPSSTLAGKLNLEEFAALLKQSPLLISNNTGPVHIAAAVGTPVVDLYALTNPQHTPWKIPHRVLNHDVPCKYCYKSVCPELHHNCLGLVMPQEVVEAALELLQETAVVEPIMEAPL